MSEHTTENLPTESATETAIEKRQAFSPDELRLIQDWQDAQAFIEGQGADLHDASLEIGDGFTMLEDKSVLVNTPFIMLAWTFTPGDFGQPYVIARVVTSEGDKYVVTDGGTGVCAQLKAYTERTGRDMGLMVKRGLRKSEYDNEFGHGVTFYLNV